MKRFWRSLEEVAGPAAVAAEWRRWVGDGFRGVKTEFLRRGAARAGAVPCPRGCGCEHDVVEHLDGTLVGVCACNPWKCENIELALGEVEIWELDWKRLARAVARAFDCDPQAGECLVAGTVEVALFGGVVPVVLTIQQDGEDFRNAVAQIIAKFRERFVLLAPTARFHAPGTHALLRNVNAGFFDLESEVTVLPNGGLRARKSGGELFAKFLPEQEKSLTESEAQRVFRLMRLLDDGKKKTKAPLSTVFRLYVFENYSRQKIARHCECVPGLITKQFKVIERIMKLPRQELRALASSLVELGAPVEDSRARNIYRKGLIDDTGEDENND